MEDDFVTKEIQHTKQILNFFIGLIAKHNQKVIGLLGVLKDKMNSIAK
jgi:hypothetical protein